MKTESDYSKISQNDLIIKILEFVCNNRNIHHITTTIIKSELYPELELSEVENLFSEIKSNKFSKLNYWIEGNKYYLTHRPGLDEFVIEFKKMTKKGKLHRIVQFLSTEMDRLKKTGFNSGEIAKAFTPELDIYEVNTLCKILISNGDVRDCTTKDESRKRMIAISVINATHEAYYNKKYLEEDELFSVPINQNIVTGDNVIFGNVSGTVTQEDHSTVRTTKANGKPKWLKWLKLIIGILLLAAGLIASIISIIKSL